MTVSVPPERPTPSDTDHSRHMHMVDVIAASLVLEHATTTTNT